MQEPHSSPAPSQQPSRFFCPQYVTAPLEFMHQTRELSMMPLEVKMLHSSLNQLLDCCEPCFISSILKYPDVPQRGDIIIFLYFLMFTNHTP